MRNSITISPLVAAEFLFTPFFAEDTCVYAQALTPYRDVAEIPFGKVIWTAKVI